MARAGLLGTDIAFAEVDFFVFFLLSKRGR
jgi:hypothetical protein